MLPREKLLEKGVNNLSPTELLAIIISKGVSSRSFLDIAKDTYSVLRKEINGRNDLKLESLRSINGLGQVKIMQILAGIELGRRLYSSDREFQELKSIANTKEAYEEVKFLSKYRQERLYAIFLNARFQIIAKKVISIGTVDRLNTDTREVVIPALKFNCASVVIAHNHPSGDPCASDEDIKFTKDLKNSLEMLGIKLLEHIIVSNNSWQRVDI